MVVILLLHNEITITLDLSPAPPVLVQTTTPVDDSATTIIGTAQPGSILTLTQNALVFAPITVGSDGTFSIDATLAVGQNTFSATVADTVGESCGSEIIIITLRAPPVAIPVFTTPSTTPTTVTESSFTIEGTSTGVKTITLHNYFILLGGTSPDSDGNWSFDVTLNEGDNSFTAVATDVGGNVSIRTGPVIITFVPALTLNASNQSYTQNRAVTELTYTVTDANGASRGVAFTVTVNATEAGFADLNNAVLPEVARAIADQTVGAITERIGQAGNSTTRSVTIAGQSTLAGAASAYGADRCRWHAESEGCTGQL